MILLMGFFHFGKNGFECHCVYKKLISFTELIKKFIHLYTCINIYNLYNILLLYSTMLRE